MVNFLLSKDKKIQETFTVPSYQSELLCAHHCPSSIQADDQCLVVSLLGQETRMTGKGTYLGQQTTTLFGLLSEISDSQKLAHSELSGRKYFFDLVRRDWRRPAVADTGLFWKSLLCTFLLCGLHFTNLHIIELSEWFSSIFGII